MARAISDVNTLANVPVDTVLDTIDVERERLPSPTELYQRWERQHWTVQELDFGRDREQWQAMSPAFQDRRLRSFVGFLHGEVATDAVVMERPGAPYGRHVEAREVAARAASVPGDHAAILSAVLENRPESHEHTFVTNTCSRMLLSHAERARDADPPWVRARAAAARARTAPRKPRRPRHAAL